MAVADSEARPAELQAGPAAALLFVSGAAALVYETLWVRQLGRVVGVEVHAVSIALSAFFAGLALGNAWLGRLADRVPRPFRLYAQLEAGAAVLGVNSRDLDSFRVDTAAAWAILRAVPRDRLAVAESGMATVADVEAAATAGADAVLVGTALSSAAEPDALLARLSRVARRGR